MRVCEKCGHNHDGPCWDEAVDLLNQCRDQRDALRAALEPFILKSDPGPNKMRLVVVTSDELQRARAALAKAKGGG